MKAALLVALGLALLPQEDERARLERVFAKARDRTFAARAQAAQRFAAGGAPARALALEATAAGTEAVAALGPDLVAVLPALDAELAARVETALEDPDFPWRPAAARALVPTATAEARGRWVARLDDPIGPVRAEAVDALGFLEARDLLPRLRRALADPDERVRRRAAVVLDGWGERDALYWLLEELRRDDVFLGNPTGRVARSEAARLLADVLGEELELDPFGRPDDANHRALIARVEGLLEARGGTPPEALPNVARATAGDLGEVLGLEIASCRRGEFALRFTADDELLVGYGTPRRLALAAGTSARLVAAFEKAFGAEPGRTFGDPGCDREAWHLRPAGKGRSSWKSVTKGFRPRPDLRPEALSTLAAALVAALPDPALAAEVRAALEAVGGELP